MSAASEIDGHQTQFDYVKVHDVCVRLNLRCRAEYCDKLDVAEQSGRKFSVPDY